MAADMIAGRYRLVGRLGHGAMSEVWAADDEELGRRVAVKILGPDADPARFDREARAAASLAHPNITQIYDYGETAGRPYMVLEYLPGGTLEDRLASGKPLADDESERIAQELAAGLAHAHARGLVHRDLKPGNVLFDAEGRAKIADFGIARLGDGGTLTEAGTVLGTAAYISPEQAAGEPATPASDVYSFGVILFRMLTGRLPFEARSPMDLVAMHQTKAPPPIGSLRPDAPPRLESVATAALAKDPADRPQDGGALVAELGAPPTATTMLMAGDATEVMPARRAAPPADPHRRRRMALLAVLAAALVAAGVGVAYAVTREGDTGATTDSTAPSLPTRKAHTTTAAATTAPATTAAPSTTAPTTTATTAHTTTHAPPTTAPPPPTTTAPPPPTTAPPPTTVPPPTTQPPPTTTAP